MADAGKGRGEAILESLEIEGASAFVDLHRIAAAHGDVGLSLAREMSEMMLNAYATLWIAFGLNGLKAAGPDIAGNKVSMECRFAASEEFDGLGNFEGSDEINDRAEDADGVAGFFETSAGGIEKASKAGRFARQNGHGDAITSDGGGINPGSASLDGEVIDEEAGLEIVGAVED